MFKPRKTLVYLYDERNEAGGLRRPIKVTPAPGDIVVVHGLIHSIEITSASERIVELQNALAEPSEPMER